MSSPRSMWTGSITIGLVSFPVSIGKSWADEREPSLRDLCSCHNLPINRTERCSETGRPPQGKVKGVAASDNTWFALDEHEYQAIEDATKSDTLTVLDVQPIWEVPFHFGTGTYYVRFNPIKKGSTAGLDAFATFTKALGEKAAIVKWSRAAKQSLAMLHADNEGHLLLTKLPMFTEWRAPDKAENFHLSVKVPDEAVTMMTELLNSFHQGEDDDAFAWDAFTDEGLALRSAKVEQILRGEEIPKEEPKQEQHAALDLMETLRASMKENA